MKIIRTTETAGPRVLALGTFDGVHRGHQELIRLGKKLAEESGALLRVCTFDRHPLEILSPDRAPSRLTTAEEQAELMEQYGADELRVIPFSRETAETEPEAFLRLLRRECGLSAVVAGWNYTFGRGGRGNAGLLQSEGTRAGYRALIVPSVKTAAGEVISSTAVRQKQIRGDADGAREMLGYPYRITGPVVNGKHQGSRIGFPTANIQYEEKKQLPAFGVYVCRLISGREAWNAVVNIGIQPTIPSGKVTVEVHTMDANPDLYGKEVRAEILTRLRGEIRFSCAGELAEQIRRDREKAAAWFREHTDRTDAR